MVEGAAETDATRAIVLVVDDTPDSLAVLTEALERSGYTALVATGGGAALSICARITPDVVLLDAVMPGIDGFETCRRLKATPALTHVPVIFMTALSDTGHIVQGFAAGGVDYVTKPIVLDELFARIRVHLANARAALSTRLALATAGGSLLALDREGTVLWTTPQAAQMLAAHGGPDALGPTLPEATRAALRAAIETGPGAAPVPVPVPAPAGAGGPSLLLTFVGAAGAGDTLFRLTRQEAEADALRRRFALTAREAEVLLWVARGKANRDVATILDLSPRTVNKHLETIFRKMGVENRASAAVLASRFLDDRAPPGRRV